MPADAGGHRFRIYRSHDLILVRNTGDKPLWNRGRLVESGSFLRMRERQPLVLAALAGLEASAWLHLIQDGDPMPRRWR